MARIFVGGAVMSSLAVPSRKQTVFLVSEKFAARKALSRLLQSLGFEALAFPSAQSFLKQIDSSVPGCLLLDVFTRGPKVSEFQQILAEDYKRPTVLIANQGEVRLAVQAMKAGAVDFLTKPIDSGDLLRAIRSALEKDQQMRIAKAQLSLVVAEFKSFEQRLGSLTPREREVLECLLAEERNKEVAFHLGITEKTVKVHRARVIKKMGVQSLAGLIRTASQRGIGLGLYSPPAPAWPRYSRLAS